MPRQPQQPLAQPAKPMLCQQQSVCKLRTRRTRRLQPLQLQPPLTQPPQPDVLA